MIVHAKVAKLYQYLHDDHFSRVMALVEAAMDEGLDSYELEVDSLDQQMTLDLIDAFESMGYVVTYQPSEEMMYVSIDD